MRGVVAKRLRNLVKGNPLERRPMYQLSPSVNPGSRPHIQAVGPRADYRALKKSYGRVQRGF